MVIYDWVIFPSFIRTHRLGLSEESMKKLCLFIHLYFSAWLAFWMMFSSLYNSTSLLQKKKNDLDIVYTPNKSLDLIYWYPIDSVFLLLFFLKSYKGNPIRCARFDQLPRLLRNNLSIAQLDDNARRKVKRGIRPKPYVAVRFPHA